MTFGEYLKIKRVAAGFTQVSLASELGFKTGQFISNIERGVSGLPPAYIKKVSKLLKCPVSDLVALALSYREESFRKTVGKFK